MIGGNLPPKVRAAIIAYDGSHVEAAEKYGVSVTMASRLRRGEGVTGRRNTIFTPAEVEQMEAMRAAGKSSAYIAKQLGKPQHSVACKLQRMAAFVRPRPVVVAPWVARALHAYKRQGYNC